MFAIAGSRPSSSWPEFDHLVKQAKRWFKQKHMPRALECFILADCVRLSNTKLNKKMAAGGKDKKLHEKIESIKQSIKTSSLHPLDQSVIDAFDRPSTELLQPIDNDNRFSRFPYSNDVNVHITSVLDGVYRVEASIFDKLFSWQRQGLHWLCALHARRVGGILADEMGLGKSFQSAAYISTLIHSGLARTALLIAPLAVMNNWKNELSMWCPNIGVFDYHSATDSKKEKVFQGVVQQGGIMLINMEAFSGKKGTSRFFAFHMDAELAQSDDDEDEDDKENKLRFSWDTVVLDEGHRIKNPDTFMTQSIKQIPSTNRIILTGTPVQNDLNELWCLFDFAENGRLLGDRRTFRDEFAQSIERGLQKNATPIERAKSQSLLVQLRSLIEPHLLRREKSTVELASSGVMTSTKSDLCVWLRLTNQQMALYKSCLESDELKQLLNSTRSPLAALTLLKKVCDHPRRINANMKYAGGKLDQSDDEDGDQSIKPSIHPLFDQNPPTVEELIKGSEKLRVLLQLLSYHCLKQRRTLIFSQSSKMLDLIEPVLQSRSITSIRIDGSVKPNERAARIQEFSSNPSIDCFLLTTGVGGVGLNLTAASRVILYDPSWNPAVDSQAVDRCFRIGQKVNVIVHRFITANTVEEVIYRKQIFKGSLSRSIQKSTDESSAAQSAGQSLFTREELREVFRLPDQHAPSATLTMLHDKFTQLHQTVDLELREHLQYLDDQNILGVSHHNLLSDDKVQKQHRPPDEEKADGDMEEEAERAVERLRADCQEISPRSHFSMPTPIRRKAPSSNSAHTPVDNHSIKRFLEEAAVSIDLTEESDEEEPSRYPEPSAPSERLVIDVPADNELDDYAYLLENQDAGQFHASQDKAHQMVQDNEHNQIESNDSTVSVDDHLYDAAQQYYEDQPDDLDYFEHPPETHEQEDHLFQPCDRDAPVDDIDSNASELPAPVDIHSADDDIAEPFLREPTDEEEPGAAVEFAADNQPNEQPFSFASEIVTHPGISGPHVQNAQSAHFQHEEDEPGSIDDSSLTPFVRESHVVQENLHQHSLQSVDDQLEPGAELNPNLCQDEIISQSSIIDLGTQCVSSLFPQSAEPAHDIVSKFSDDSHSVGLPDVHAAHCVEEPSHVCDSNVVVDVEQKPVQVNGSHTDMDDDEKEDMLGPSYDNSEANLNNSHCHNADELLDHVDDTSEIDPTEQNHLDVDHRADDICVSCDEQFEQLVPASDPIQNVETLPTDDNRPEVKSQHDENEAGLQSVLEARPVVNQEQLGTPVQVHRDELQSPVTRRYVFHSVPKISEKASEPEPFDTEAECRMHLPAPLDSSHDSHHQEPIASSMGMLIREKQLVCDVIDVDHGDVEDELNSADDMSASQLSDSDEEFTYNVNPIHISDAVTAPADLIEAKRLIQQLARDPYELSMEECVTLLEILQTKKLLQMTPDIAEMLVSLCYWHQDQEFRPLKQGIHRVEQQLNFDSSDNDSD